MVQAKLSIDKSKIALAGIAKYMGSPGGGGGPDTLCGRLEGGLPDAAWDPVIEIIHDATRMTFDKAGNKEGYIPWTVLVHENYGEWKGLCGLGDRLLVLSGHLRAQLTGAARGYEKRESHSLVLGSDYPVPEGSGRRSGPLSDGIMEPGIDGVTDENDRWSADPDDEDIGGLMASGAPGDNAETMLWDVTEGSLVPVPARPMWRFDRRELDAICDAILDYITKAPKVARGRPTQPTLPGL